ncbi:MAG TPA: hypothetical protein PKA88_18405 [Polyangiaceae bacterium]|nr:hypothetical protein [Polyangiaceae bacterium]
MATKEEPKLSRRARRRAAADAAGASGEAPPWQSDDSEDDASAPAEDDASAAEPEEESDDSEDDAPDAEPEDETEARRPKAAAAAAPKKKKKKRGAAAEDADDPSKIRDRNKRLRAEAARKRRAKRERERDGAAAQGLDASELVDDALARGSHAATKWVRNNFGLLQWALLLVVGGVIGWQIYAWRTKQSLEKNSDQLIAAVEAETGLVGAPPSEDPTFNPKRTFASHAERLKAAEEEYRSAAKALAGKGPGILAELGLAGVLYDQAKYDEALQSYESVVGSPLAKHDTDVRFRAIEGVGLCREAKGDAAGAEKAFKELEAADSQGFVALSFFHQARLAYAAGKKDKVKELLAKSKEKAEADKSPFATASYLERASRDLLAAVDPSVARTPSSQYSPEQMDALKEQIMKDPSKLKKMLEDMQKNVKDLTKDLPGPEDVPPGAPAPAPGAPTTGQTPSPLPPAPQAPASPPTAPPAPPTPAPAP